MLRLKNVKIVLTIFFVGFSGLLSLKSSIIEVKSNGVNSDIYFYDYSLLVDNRYKFDSAEINKKIDYIRTCLPYVGQDVNKDSYNYFGITEYPKERSDLVIKYKEVLEIAIINRIFEYLHDFFDNRQCTNCVFRKDEFGILFRTIVMFVLIDTKFVDPYIFEQISRKTIKLVSNACPLTNDHSCKNSPCEEYKEQYFKRFEKHIFATLIQLTTEKFENDNAEILNCLKLVSEYYVKENLLQDLKNKYEATHKNVLSGANQLKGVYKFFTNKIRNLSTKVCKQNKKHEIIKDVEKIIIDELNEMDPDIVSQNSIHAKIDYLVTKHSYNIESSDNPDDYNHAIKAEEDLSQLMLNLYLNIRNTIFTKYPKLKY